MMQVIQPQGWMCPNCGSAHAPSVMTCPMAAKPATTTTITVSDCGCGSSTDPLTCPHTACPRKLRPYFTYTSQVPTTGDSNG